MEKKNKKLYAEIMKQQDQILDEPTLGAKLKGDLKEFRSHDFIFQRTELRICYAYFEDDQHIKFVYFGTRENFYDEVKRYVR